MKRIIAKLAALLLAIALVLSGCGDPVKEIEKETARLKKEYAGVVASYDGGEVTIGESRPYFNQIYSYIGYYGYDVTAEETQGMMADVLEVAVYYEVAAKHFDAEYALTEEEIAGVKASADEKYNSMYEIAVSYAEDESGAEAESDAEKAALVQQLMVRSCMDYDSIYDALLLQKKAERMAEILGEGITGASEEEILAAYEARIFENEASYEEAGSFFELDMITDEAVVCWIPDGYRTAKHILLTPGDEVMEDYIDVCNALEEGEAALLALEEEKKDAEDDDSEEGPARSVEELEGLIAAAEAEIERLEAELEAAEAACLADVKETSDEIYARLAAGEDFAALIAEYGQDPGMQMEPSMSTGYYVSAESYIWWPEFRDTVMSLSNPGDYALEPMVSASGVHIVRYEGDVAGGPVPLEQVRDRLQDEVLTEARSAHAEEVISAWVEEAKASYDVEKFVKAFVADGD